MKLRLFTGEMLLKGRMLDYRDTALLEAALRQRLAAGLTDTPESAEILRRLRFRYPHEAAARLYPKHSVSEIKEEALEAFEAGRKTAEGALDRTVPAPAFSEVIPDHSDTVNAAGRVYAEPAGAAVGDAYHHALAAYDYLDPRGMEQLPELVPAAELALINPARFRTFLDSPLAVRFAAAAARKQLFREQHFMKQVPYEYLFPDSGIREEVLLQGIIDAFFFEEDGIVLVDYKSDHVRGGSVLVGRYRKQLELYADALTAMLGLPVKEKLIYSIFLGVSIPL